MRRLQRLEENLKNARGSMNTSDIEIASALLEAYKNSSATVDNMWYVLKIAKQNTELEDAKKEIAELRKGLKNIIDCKLPPDEGFDDFYEDGVNRGMDWAIDWAAAALSTADKLKN